ncbi:hypothetical protein ABT294_34835 [Nonomuraea sp. NPDC000554]|uniref:hypothetical protein n=1 Tax=Nonomuraea sp. NPDC000554 TaxID=3154259 RepID=UPI00332346B3
MADQPETIMLVGVYGRLYVDRMRPSITPIPVAEYRGTGSPWNYKDTPADYLPPGE